MLRIHLNSLIGAQGHQAQIEERFTTLYDEALRLHGDALSDPEAKFAVLLSAVESGG